MVNISVWEIIPAVVLSAMCAAAARESVPPALEKTPLPVWEIQPSGTNAGLRGLSAVSRDAAWASGAQGTFLRTTDGGRHWQIGHVPGAEDLDFRDVQAFSAECACLLSAGRPAKIFRTRDGGRTWVETYSNNAEGIFFDAFAFFDEKRGLAVGDPLDGRFMILFTDDGGWTWNEAPASSRPMAGEGESAFAASGTCLTVSGKDNAWFCTGGALPRVLRSKDGGRTWEAVPSPLDLGAPSSGGFSLVFSDRNNGVMVGGDYRNEEGARKTAAFSGDGGKTWRLVLSDGPAGFRECVAFVPKTVPQMVIAVGPTGSDVSIDGGRSWAALPGPGFHSLSFSPIDGAGWAAGRNGIIARFNGNAARALLKK